eukprot:scaffold142045_cov34-Tisochrysis_lutea.AAC.1
MPPPLPATRLGFDLTPAGKPIVIEFYLDFICPFSTKMYRTVYHQVLEKFGPSVNFVLHQVPQPWHAQGSYVHEAVICVREVAPSKYAAFVMSIADAFDNKGMFTDSDTWNKTRAQVYADLIALAAQTLSESEVKKVESMLQPKGDSHAGNQAMQQMKWITKGHRSRAVHITPTVYVNGVEASIVSSGWSGEQWEKFLTPLGSDSFQGSLLE